jgi:hypothetical protein
LSREGTLPCYTCCDTGPHPLRPLSREGFLSCYRGLCAYGPSEGRDLYCDIPAVTYGASALTALEKGGISLLCYTCCHTGPLRLWPLRREGFLSCYTCCDMGPLRLWPFRKEGFLSGYTCCHTGPLCLWPLRRQGFLSCYACCDMGLWQSESLIPYELFIQPVMLTLNL